MTDWTGSFLGSLICNIIDNCPLPELLKQKHSLWLASGGCLLCGSHATCFGLDRDMESGVSCPTSIFYASVDQ